MLSFAFALALPMVWSASLAIVPLRRISKASTGRGMFLNSWRPRSMKARSRRPPT